MEPLVTKGRQTKTVFPDKKTVGIGKSNRLFPPKHDFLRRQNDYSRIAQIIFRGRILKIKALFQGVVGALNNVKAQVPVRFSHLLAAFVVNRHSQNRMASERRIVLRQTLLIGREGPAPAKNKPDQQKERHLLCGSHIFPPEKY